MSDPTADERRHGDGRNRRQSDRGLEAFADRIGVGVFLLQDRFRYVNRAMAQLAGHGGAALARLHLADLVEPEQRAAVRRHADAVLGGASPAHRQTLRLWVGGAAEPERWVDLTLQPLEFEGAPAVLGTVYDVTERVQHGEALARATETLRQAMHEAEAASRAKSAFLAAMSHEMRTPLNAVLGMVEVLADSPLTDEQRGHLEMMDRAGHALMTLITDILDLAKVEAGQFELQESEFDLGDLLEEVLDFHRMEARRRGLELACSLAPGLPSWRRGDRARLRQVLLNLVGNALKFTDTGAVSVEAGAVAGDPGRVRVAVRDTGIGIPADALQKVFEMFVQVDSSPTRRHAGVGLGLAICKRLVEMMHGGIWVESELGQGSVFCFEIALPPGLAGSAVAAGPAFSAQTLQGQAVLIVDDIAVNRLFARAALAASGARIDEAAGVDEALARLQAALAAGAPYRLVITDYRMPGRDGLELVRSYRAQAGSERSAIIMASSEQNELTARWTEQGLDGFLLKPVKRAELLAAVAAALDPAAAPRPSGTHVPLRAGRSGVARRLLLADDNADNRALVLAYLKHHPYDVELAENGREAVEKFQRGDAELVLMDVQMPELDGLAATRAIRRWEAETGRAPRPVVILTSHAHREDIQRSFDAGATGHLVKPLRKQTLLEALARHLPPR